MSDWSASRLYPPRVLDRREYEPRRAPARTLADLAMQAYEDPDQFATYEQFLRWTHADLDEMPLEQLERERGQASLRSMSAPDSITLWLRDRIRKLDELIARHKAQR